MNYTYFLKSLKNDRIYVGSTRRDPKVRLQEHNRGLNKWTKENGPFDLIYFEEYICYEDSKKREKFYKTGFGRKIRDAILQVI